MKFILNLILPILILSIPTLASNQASTTIVKGSTIIAKNQSYQNIGDTESLFQRTNSQGRMNNTTSGSLNNNIQSTNSSMNGNEMMPSLVKSANYSGSLDFCGSKIPIQIQDVRERLEKEMLLILWDRAQVILWIKRASQYFPHMDRILKEYGLPLELKYVAVIESGLRSQAGSNKGAVGTWQFMPATGQEYGLRLDENIDARRNLIESTRAACEYFRKLYARFNSWTLALAAYNMGENGLSREIALQEVYDYYRLYLPQETQRYVLRVIVAREIMENPGKYGFYFSNEDYYPTLDFAKVTVDCPIRIPITMVARAAGSYFKEIKDLNPDIKGYYLDRGRYSILIPPGMDKFFYQEFSKELSRYNKGGSVQQKIEIPLKQSIETSMQKSIETPMQKSVETPMQKSVETPMQKSVETPVQKKEFSIKRKSETRTASRHHVVRVGDSLTGIAQTYRIPFPELLKWNNLSKKSVIKPGQKLIIKHQNP